MNEGFPRVPTQQSSGTADPHAAVSVLVWEMETWIWGCQTLKDPSQLLLSSSKGEHKPGGEPARSPPGSSAALGHRDKGQRLEKEGKGIRYEWRSG